MIDRQALLGLVSLIDWWTAMVAQVRALPGQGGSLGYWRPSDPRVGQLNALWPWWMRPRALVEVVGDGIGRGDVVGAGLDRAESPAIVPPPRRDAWHLR